VPWFHGQRPRSDHAEASKILINNILRSTAIWLPVLKKKLVLRTSVRWKIGEVVWSNGVVKDSPSDQEGEQPNYGAKKGVIKSKWTGDAT
jgi:hypothetical protein